MILFVFYLFCFVLRSMMTLELLRAEFSFRVHFHKTRTCLLFETCFSTQYKRTVVDSFFGTENQP